MLIETRKGEGRRDESQSSKKPKTNKTKGGVNAHPDSDSRHTVGLSVGSLVRAAACLARTDTTPPCSSDREPRPVGGAVRDNDKRYVQTFPRHPFHLFLSEVRSCISHEHVFNFITYDMICHL